MAFHVVETARMTDGPVATTPFEGQFGAFQLSSPEPGWTLMVIADDGAQPESEGWEHVSVHARNSQHRMRTPTWKEMAYVKGLFWDDDDVVVQFHPKKSEYVNVHPHVLHLWRHRTLPFPTPPPSLVGPL